MTAFSINMQLHSRKFTSLLLPLSGMTTTRMYSSNLALESDTERTVNYPSEFTSPKSSELAKAVKRAYYLRTKDNVKQYNLEYYERNKDDRKKAVHEYYVRTKDDKRNFNEAYYDEHGDKLRKSFREYYNRNKKHISNMRKDYYARNKLRMRETDREYRKRNKDNKRRANREYYLRTMENPEDYQPRHFEAKSWKTPDLVREFFDTIAKPLSISEISNWYRISRTQICDLGGMICNSPLIYLLLFRCNFVQQI